MLSLCFLRLLNLSQIWPILPGVSHWIQYTQCVVILQIAMCEIHPTRSWGSSHITQNETASCILPLFFHFAVLSGRLGPCSCEALWWKPIRQILEECSRGTMIPGCQSAPQSHINYISHAGLKVSLNYIIFLFWYKRSGGGLCCSIWEKIASGFRKKYFVRFINNVCHSVSDNVGLKLFGSQIWLESFFHAWSGFLSLLGMMCSIWASAHYFIQVSA